MKSDVEKKHTTTFQNICQVMKVLFSCYPIARWKTAALIIFRVGEPLLITAVPSIAIAAITEGEIQYYLFCMVGVLLLLGMLKAATDILDLDLFLYRVNCGCSGLFQVSETGFDDGLCKSRTAQPSEKDS